MRPARFVTIALAVAAATALPAAMRPETTPSFSATYRADRVVVGSGTVDLDFSARILNMGPVDAVVRSIRLASPGSAVSPYAEFDGAQIPSGGDTEVSARVTISTREWQRWQNGGPATLFLFVERRSGDLGRTRVEAYREAGAR